MLKYDEYKSTLFVEANQHIQHIEDSLFLGSSSINGVISFLESIADMLKTRDRTSVNVTIKWDGSPAIICGINPENKKFFVATKGLFNKRPKICYTPEDIKSYFVGDLRHKMLECLKHLPKLGIKSIYQGDLMYTQRDIKTQRIDDTEYITFNPNTIVYAVPTNSKLAKRVKQSKIGIIFHTKYTGTSISNLTNNFGITTETFNKTKDVWFDDANFNATSNLPKLDEQSENDFFVAMSEVKMYARLLNKSFLDELITNKQIVNILNQYTNQRVRDGELNNVASEFIQFVSDKKPNKESLIDYLKINIDDIKVIFLLHHAITRAKIILINKLCIGSDISTFIQSDDGFESVDPEGFVVTSKLDGGVVKLIDRLTFSRNNFKNNKR